MPPFQGPVQPGTSEEVFRETGVSQRVFQGPVRPGTDERRFRRTGRSSGGGDRTPPPSFRSSLLGKSFGSRAALNLAEGEFRAERSRIAEQTRVEAATARASRIAGETAGGKNRFGRRDVGAVSRVSKLEQFGITPPPSGGTASSSVLGIRDILTQETIGDVQTRLRKGKREELISGFQSLTPEQAETKALAGEKGFTGFSTAKGTSISFDTGVFGGDITSAGSLGAVRKELGTVGFTQAAGRSVGVGAGKFGLGVPEFIVEDIIWNIGVTDPTSPKRKDGILGGTESKFFDGGIFGKSKKTPGDIVQTGTQIALIGGLAAPSALRIGGITRTEGLGAGVRELATEFSVIRPKPGRFTPNIVREPIKIDTLKEVNIQRGTDTLSIGELTGTGRQADINIRATGLRAGKGGVQTTEVDVPFIEIGRGGKIDTGRIREIRFDKPPKQVGGVQDRFATLDLSKDIGLNLPTREFVSGGQRSFSSELPLRNVRTPTGALKAEEFIASFGQQPTFIRRGLPGKNAKIKQRISKQFEQFGTADFGEPITLPGRRTTQVKFDGFFGQVTGKGKRLTIRLPEPEVDLSGFKVQTGGRRGSSRGLGQELVQDFTQPTLDIGTSLKKIQKSIQAPKQSDILLGSDVFQTQLAQPSAFAGTGLFERTQDVSFGGGTKQVVSQTDLIGGFEIDRLGFGGVTRLGQGGKQPSRTNQILGTGFKGGLGEVLGVSQIQAPGQRTDLRFKQGQRQSQKERQKEFLEAGLGFEGFRGRGRFGFLPAFPPLPGILDLPGLRARGKRKQKRTPSFISLLTDFQVSPFSLEQEKTGLIARSIRAPKRGKRGRTKFNFI